MKIVCIGAGRLAHHLMPELQHAGCDLVQIYNRTSWPAELFAQKYRVPDYTTDLNSVFTGADMYFITVADDAVGDIAEQLRSILDIQGTVVHCSGVLGIDILPFFRRGVFYPLQSFSEHHEVEWRETPVIITSDYPEVSGILKSLAARITTNIYEMNDEQKTVVHLAAVFANNFTNHMLTLSETICRDSDVPFDILKPLIQTTVSKAFEAGPSSSQTGPAIRGDDNTIEKHLHLLEKYPEIIEVYKAITKSISNKAY